MMVLVFCFNLSIAYCQVQSGYDSLLYQLKSSKEDSNKVLLLIKIGNTLEDHNPDSAILLYTQAGDISKKINYLRGVFKYISNITAVLNFQNKFDTSLALNLQSIAIAKKLNDPTLEAYAYNNTGASYYNKKDYQSCIKYFLQAAACFEKNNNKLYVAQLYSNIAGVYSELNLNQKAYKYGLIAINVARNSSNSTALRGAYTNTSTALLGLKKYDSVLLLSNLAIQLAEKDNDNWTKAADEVNIAGVYFAQGKYDLMNAAADEAMKASESIEGLEGICKSNLYKAIYYLQKKDYATAKPFVQKAIEISKTKSIGDVLSDGYKYLSLIDFGLGDFAGYKYNQKLKDSVDDVFFSDQIVKNSQELETKYNTDKKQIEIDNLNKEKKIQQLDLRQKRILNWVLAGILLFIIIISVLSYRNYQNRKKLLLTETALQQQRISELEKEKLLLATQAVVQGQEEERTRLAKDLHDGLGGILSSTKYSLSGMKENLIISPENASAFERTMSMLDQSITELRRVAHNMMPETLMKLSLSEALQDYCTQVTQSGALNAAYQSFGTEDIVLDNSVKITVYRVVQELVNNSIKHAQAKNVTVQLIHTGNKLNLTVEDDGTGFDKTILDTASGIGYKNLQSRINFLKGNLDIQSQSAKGTSVYIEIPLTT